MKKNLFLLFAIVLIYGSCSKENSINPNKRNSFKIAFLAPLDAIANSTWQHVLGGEATLQFAVKNVDTVSVSSLSDSLNLERISTYNKQLLGGTYDISLNTESKAAADTFIRFSASVTNFLINKDQTISLPASTADGVITIAKSFVDPTQRPTFTPAGSTTPINLGFANGFYFIYVNGSSAGRITFTEATTGDLFMKDITVSAMSQYDLLPQLNSTGVRVNAYPFRLSANSSR